MADSTSHQPYQFGDVVDGYRWTITGWEPVAAPERTVGVPRLLEKRYAATQEAQARAQAATQTLEPDAPVVTDERPVVVPDDPPVVVLDETDVEVEPADGAGPDPVVDVGPEAEAEPDLEPEPPVVDVEPEAEAEPDLEPDPETAAVAEPPPIEAADVPAPSAEPEPPVADEPDRSYSLDELLNRRVVAPPAVVEELVDEEPVVATPVAEVVLVEEAVPAEPVDEALVAEDTTDDPVAHGDDLADPVAAVVDDLPADELSVEEPTTEGALATAGGSWTAHDETEGPDDAVIDLTDDAGSADLLGSPEPEPLPHDARPESMRAWYGLGIEPVEEPEPTPAPIAAEDDSDAPFAAALALGARRFAETYQPSEIEIIARTASSAARRPVDSWSALVAEPIDEWTAAPTVVPPAEQLDARALTYNATTLPVQAPAAEGRTSSTFEAPAPEPRPEPEPEPRVVAYTPAPPAGWYPGSA
jgi:hypothetical protein